MTRSLRMADIHWLAGLLEGEGCFSISRGRYPLIVLNMSDRDVVEKAQRICGGVGRIKENPPGTKGYKPMWEWRVHSEDAIGIMMTVLCLMGERRQKRIREVIAGWGSVPARPFWTRRWKEEAAALRTVGKRRCTDCLQPRPLESFFNGVGNARCKPCRSAHLTKKRREGAWT